MNQSHNPIIKRLLLSLIAVAIAQSFMISSESAGIKGDTKRGQKIFQDMQCAICHTNGGNNLNPDRPLIGEVFLKRYPANDNKGLEKIIREGITAKGMPQFGKDKMSDQDLADVVAYIRSLTPNKPAKPAVAPKKGKK